MYDESEDSDDYAHSSTSTARYRRGNNSYRRGKQSYNPKPHLVTIVKSNTGFGFNVKGQVSEGGQLRSINGELYAPLQHVSAVLPGGAAERATLRKGDRILEVNAVNVEGATHKQVVELIKHGGDQLKMLVISVPDSEANRFENGEESTISFRHDYSDSRSLPISIPTCQTISNKEGKFVVFHIHMAGRHLGSRRYSEFVELHNLLKREFCDFAFPKLPGKWPFTLSEQQLDTRRRGLELYLEKICSVRVIADSDIMQDFLMECDSICEVDLRVLLPDGKTVAFSCARTSSTSTVYSLVQSNLLMTRETATFCALYEALDPNFERKLCDEELPHSLYIQNYSSASSSCLVLRKWIFDVSWERELCERDPLFRRIVYHQTIHDINHGRIKANQKMYQLKALQSEDRAEQYLEMARALPGYACITFPPCHCDCRNSGEVILTLSFDAITLSTWPEEDSSTSIDWSMIVGYRSGEEGQWFAFEHERAGKKNKIIKMYTQYGDYMAECFARIRVEKDMAVKRGDRVEILNGVKRFQSSIETDEENGDNERNEQSERADGKARNERRTAEILDEL
ncbi:unnamed protein product, partial [Mesorhabditis belari]|uniref:Sorting nexin-27 n=1 Tax=Mesorhabditis belari TaxID=2138241 RepID=A0AAF3EG73_9BILA